MKLRQRVRIVGADNCEPMANVRVNIWHCDRDGDYSGYAAMASEGLTYCRGYQMTDANGECEFVTIVPGWYPGRVTHVHFQVFVSSQYSVVSQWTWPHDAVVEAVSNLGCILRDLTRWRLQDGVFADGFEFQMADLAWDEEAQEYVSLYEATVEGAGTSGVGYQELQRADGVPTGSKLPQPRHHGHRNPPRFEAAGRGVLGALECRGPMRAFRGFGHEACGPTGHSRGFCSAWFASGILSLPRRSGDQWWSVHRREAHDPCEVKGL